MKKNIMAILSFNILFSFPTIYALNVYGGYAHAKKIVTVSSFIDFGFDGSPSVGISFSPSIVSSYDSMNTAQAYWEGIKW